MKILLAIVSTVVLTVASQAQTAPSYAERFAASYGHSPFEAAPQPAPVQAPVVVYSQAGNTLFTSAGPIVLLNTGISSGSCFGPDAGLRPFPIK